VPFLYVVETFKSKEPWNERTLLMMTEDVIPRELGDTDHLAQETPFQRCDRKF